MMPALHRSNKKQETRILAGVIMTQLPTYLNRLVRATSDQARACHIERRTEYTGLRVERTWLWYVFHILERRPSRIVPERHGTIIGCCSRSLFSKASGPRVQTKEMRTTREKDSLRVDR